MQNQKKILIISLSGIGNTLLATPFLQDLKIYFPDSMIDFLVLNKGMAEVVAENSIVNNVFILSGHFIKDFILVFKLRNKKYTYSVTLFPSNKWQFNVLAFLIGARLRVTHAYGYAKLKTVSFLQNVKIQADENIPDIEQNTNLLKAFGCSGQSKKMLLPLKEDDRRFAEYFLRERVIAGEFVIGIHPGGGGILDKSWQGLTKRWPEERFAELCDYLVEYKRARVLIFGGREEEHIKNRIKTQAIYKTELFIVDALSLTKTAGLIERCSLFISNDTSLMHIAAALNIPVLGILGPTNYKRTAPCGENAYYIKSDIACSPCLEYPFYTTNSKIKCGRELECFKNITVGAVINRLKELRLI